MSDRIQFRRDTAARWAQFNPFLLEGEIGVVLDNPNQYKVGDGVHYWNDLPLRGFNGNIVNQKGNSEDVVMSQKAVTDAINSNTAYLYCTSNAGDNKVVQNTGFDINNGIRLLIKMQYANTKASDVTLQVGTTDAKPIIYNGAAVTDENTWDANDVLDVYYDGNNYQACLHKYNEIIISNQSNSDLDISDNRGYVLARFQNGGIKTKNFDSSKDATEEERGLMSSNDKTKLNSIEEGAEINNVIINEITTNDFSISDENKNAIVIFKNGHIKTKNFDSENINPNSKLLSGKTYSIIGDSISTYQGYLPSDEPGYDGATYAYFYPKNGLNNVNQTWWKKMEVITGLTLLKNCSWSGSECCGDSTSTITAEAGCSTRRISDLSKNGVSPNIIIIYIGINDMNTYTLGTWTADEEIPQEGTITQYAKAYALCLSKVMRAYPSSEIYCCSLLECPTVDSQTGTKTFPCINSHGETLREYNKTIEEICVGIGANFIDLHSCGINYWNCYPTYFLDTTHPNSVGTTLMAKYISSKILSLTKLKY